MPNLGKKIKNFIRPATGDKNISLNDLAGKKVVLYFYPKDNTPGCTTEGQDFRDARAAFTKLNTVILGVSRDSLKKHENFKSKYAFNFDLLSDEDESLCNQFGVIQLKKNYGKEYMGIVRSTFLIDEGGVLIEQWLNVRVKGHVDDVLAACKAHR
ncbi:MAG TPA: peroxiredoxin [Gammaproteobacteria bacterium]|nr:peroxiredoxin [Gammaproteobacteria bacterium]